ncbi:MAG TPA: RNA polymerase sigma factor [Acidobacteriota bacterium]|nr:RNA polymerase sigma factor [Acidobacteriota bacterium]
MKATTAHEQQTIAEQSEIRLLEQARHGDHSALEELYSNYLKGSGAIQALLRKALPREQREDMLHEIFVQLISGRHAFRGEAQLKTYVYQIARVTIFQKYRKENTFKRGKSFRIISESSELQDLGRTNPESKYCLKQVRKIVHELIEKLPVAYKDALKLRVIKDFSYEEIAEEMSLPLNTVSTKIHKGKKLLLVSSQQHGVRELLRVF